MSAQDSGFSFSDSTLACDGVLITDLVRATGTPCYVYSGGTLRARYRALTDAFAGVPAAMHYALKANSTLALVRLLRALGAHADANSIGEIEVALRAGFIPEQIVFTGVGKSPDELERAVTLGVKCINAESAGELDRIDAIARRQGVVARVAVRINPDVDAQTHAHISTGLRRNKFGIPLEEALPVCVEASRRPGLQLVGVHAHIGSQITTLAPLVSAARALVAFGLALRARGVTLEHVDVGGGLGVSYDGESTAISPAEYGCAIIDATRELGASLVVEPGRWLVAPAGALVASVVDVKRHADGRTFVVLDAGMTELLRPALYGAFHRIVPVDRAAGRAEVSCDVVGPVCESSDTFGVARMLPEPRPGDLVAILDAGAYGVVMASNYNRRPLPPETLVDQGAWRVVRRRQSVEDMLACES